MSCHIIDHRCQPLPGPIGRPTERQRQSPGNLVQRLFRYRFLRARMFERAVGELVRREST